MTRLLSLSPKPREYASVAQFHSAVLPAVRFTIRRMSLGRRIELAQAVRELLGRLEFHEAGAGLRDQVDASILAAEIDSIYLRWALAGIEGLSIDGQPGTCERIISAAPEALVREILGRIKAECGLSDAEIKN